MLETTLRQIKLSAHQEIALIIWHKYAETCPTNMRSEFVVKSCTLVDINNTIWSLRCIAILKHIQINGFNIPKRSYIHYYVNYAMLLKAS